MKEELVLFETAKMIGSLDGGGEDFNCHPNQFYFKDGSISESGFDLAEECYPAITKSLLQKWLREEHNIHVCVDINLMKKWYVNIYNIAGKPSEFGKTYEALGDSVFANYEEALEKGLQEALKLIEK